MPFTEEYKRIKLIGRGSFAAVYKVRHKKLGYVRAIKISNEQVDSEDDKAYQSFLNECSLLLKIGNGCHPNIVHIYQPRLINRHALVEMDYVDGITLTDYMKTNRFVPMNEFWNFARGIVGAVGYCHADLYKFLMDPDTDNLESDPDDGSKYLISSEKERELKKKYCVNHNDLHSNNIMRRNYDGSYILLDFGLAIQQNQCVKSSSRGDGAHEYSSPEKLDGKEITAASDVYSLGILMYEVLAGQVPFVMGPSRSMAEVSRLYDRHLHERPAPIEPLRKAAYEAQNPGKTYVKDYPDELERVIMRCLEKDPAMRYADAKEALEGLTSAKAMDAGTDSDKAEALALLKADIDRLRKENEMLRARLNMTDGMPQEKALTPGAETDGGTVGYVDITGHHGLLISSFSQPLKWVRHVAEEDFLRFSPESREWYRSNCFILPSGSHLPTRGELQLLSPNLPVLGIEGHVWCPDEINGAEGTGVFIAVKSF